ncbi:RbsD/FucU domain-containing protein [Pseudobutyrivibrio sp.]
MSRDDFYDKSEKCVAIIQTGEERLYGDVILKKGVIK